jgi:hypothetical protein
MLLLRDESEISRRAIEWIRQYHKKLLRLGSAGLQSAATSSVCVQNHCQSVWVSIAAAVKFVRIQTITAARFSIRENKHLTSQNDITRRCARWRKPLIDYMFNEKYISGRYSASKNILTASKSYYFPEL